MRESERTERGVFERSELSDVRYNRRRFEVQHLKCNVFPLPLLADTCDSDNYSPVCSDAEDTDNDLSVNESNCTDLTPSSTDNLVNLDFEDIYGNEMKFTLFFKINNLILLYAQMKCLPRVENSFVILYLNICLSYPKLCDKFQNTLKVIIE